MKIEKFYFEEPKREHDTRIEMTDEERAKKISLIRQEIISEIPKKKVIDETKPSEKPKKKPKKNNSKSNKSTVARIQK